MSGTGHMAMAFLEPLVPLSQRQGQVAREGKDWGIPWEEQEGGENG